MRLSGFPCSPHHGWSSSGGPPRGTHVICFLNIVFLTPGQRLDEIGDYFLISPSTFPLSLPSPTFPETGPGIDPAENTPKSGSCQRFPGLVPSEGPVLPEAPPSHLPTRNGPSDPASSLPEGPALGPVPARDVTGPESAVAAASALAAPSRSGTCPPHGLTGRLSWEAGNRRLQRRHVPTGA